MLSQLYINTVTDLLSLQSISHGVGNETNIINLLKKYGIMALKGKNFGQQMTRYWIIGTGAILRKKVLARATQACEASNQAASDHFVETAKMVVLGSGAQRELEDVHLSRYACYLVVQNGDPAKPVIAAGRTYFAIQTQKTADWLTMKLSGNFVKTKSVFF